MSDEPFDAELTIKEMVELELCAINAILDTVESPPLFHKVRDRLIALLDQLDRGAILPEYAEVQLEQIRDVQEQWLRDNPIPPD
jgi:hypothetical protein